MDKYDKTYMSKVFSYTQDYLQTFAQLGEIIKGGTGYNYNKLPNEIEHIMPDYSIYKTNKAYGFLTRGCSNKCEWCIVPEKEGQIRANADIAEFWNGQKETILLDNNVLAHNHGLSQIEKIIDLGIKVDFNQGLDARIIAQNKDIAKLLSKVKWVRFVRLACDIKAQMPFVEKAVNYLKIFGIKGFSIFVYVLIKDIEDALIRVNFLKQLDVIPFAQPFRDFTTNKEPSKESKRFARWVNHKAIFNSIEFDKYK